MPCTNNYVFKNLSHLSFCNNFFHSCHPAVFMWHLIYSWCSLFLTRKCRHMYFQLLKEKENVTWCLLSIFAMFKKSTDEMYIPSPCDLWIISCKISHIYFTIFSGMSQKTNLAEPHGKILLNSYLTYSKKCYFAFLITILLWLFILQCQYCTECWWWLF